MSMNERIIALADDVNDLLTKESPIGSQDFIKLAARLMNFSDLTLSLERLEQEERKEVEFEWIWKNNIV
jgi:hypothetical protein